MVCLIILSGAYKSSSQSSLRFYAGCAMRPSSCQQLLFLLVAFGWWLGFSFQVSGKHSTFQKGRFPAYHPIVLNDQSLRRELLAIGDTGITGQKKNVKCPIISKTNVSEL